MVKTKPSSKVQRLTSDFLSNDMFLAVGRVGSSTDLIAQRVQYVLESDKRSHLMDLLHVERENGICGEVKSDSNSSSGIVLKFTSTVNRSMSVLLTSHGMDHVSSAFSKVIRTSEHKGNAPRWVINEGSIEMKGYVLTEIHALCYRSNAPPKEMELKSRPLGPNHAVVASSTDYFAVLCHVTVKTSSYKPDLYYFHTLFL